VNLTAHRVARLTALVCVPGPHRAGRCSFDHGAEPGDALLLRVEPSYSAGAGRSGGGGITSAAQRPPTATELHHPRPTQRRASRASALSGGQPPGIASRSLCSIGRGRCALFLRRPRSRLIFELPSADGGPFIHTTGDSAATKE
jgi:hypothetical protein